MKNDIFFYQMQESESSTYTYILADPESREAIIIDSVRETAERDAHVLKDFGFKLKYVLDTHVHADHVTGAAELRKKTGAKTAISKSAGVSCADLLLEDGQELSFGSYKVKCLATPGHTDGCMSFYCEGRVFTGDALLIRAAGRTDFQQGSSQKLYQSIHSKLFSLPENTLLYPGHDYKGLSYSTIGLEKNLNPRIGGGKTEQDFIKIMSELKLSPPKKIGEAVPANLQCGEI